MIRRTVDSSAAAPAGYDEKLFFFEPARKFSEGTLPKIYKGSLSKIIFSETSMELPPTSQQSPLWVSNSILKFFMFFMCSKISKLNPVVIFGLVGGSSS